MNIEWKVEASEDLDRVIEHVARNRPGDEDDEAIKVLDAVDLIATQPNAGRAGRVSGIREWVAVYPWVIVYLVQDKDTLVIIRVLHGKQKWP